MIVTATPAIFNSSYSSLISFIKILNRMKEILGLGDYGQKITDITKKYLNTIWKKRKLNNKGQKHNRAEKTKH